ncbi:Tubulin/FtsZ, GTPase domain [Pseudocohnilembus persalinus]|uniref:Tubulin/FtsZ, GTPase domain n=1 Tax=Pseudocohnilembus persalinus TaxID=266149 RepID=A0A0V0QBQ2_PSEPJ|nr:Tubulin/FtsZ, GTPase domain [Pseudocohnilembus persalinus]|eukprot:KRW99670.1 Tubulin/FtsZ, GTPase domain [Pseudocohnilembus persalinus]
MPRELVTIQVGQCGNQIGMKFWELALKEHSQNNKNGIYDDALSSFFKNAIIVDMEEGVINQMLKSDIGEIFDDRQFIHDVSGAGNNWAHGYHYYGNKYRENIVNRIRKTVEECDSIQCFFLMHSLGGGTGSGLGSRILTILKEEFPEVYRFTASVFPQKEDDVVTSPYNSMFSLNEIYQSADCQKKRDLCRPKTKQIYL